MCSWPIFTWVITLCMKWIHNVLHEYKYLQMDICCVIVLLYYYHAVLLYSTVLPHNVTTSTYIMLYFSIKTYKWTFIVLSPRLYYYHAVLQYSTVPSYKFTTNTTYIMSYFSINTYKWTFISLWSCYNMLHCFTVFHCSLTRLQAPPTFHFTQYWPSLYVHNPQYICVCIYIYIKLVLSIPCISTIYI